MPLDPKELKQEDITPAHEALLAHCKGLVRKSRDVMSQYYTDWDNYDLVYTGKRVADTEDKKAAERKEPTKMAIPLTFGQIQTFCVVAMSLLRSEEEWFPMAATGPEDEPISQVASKLLERDLEHEDFVVKVFQTLIDVSRFGLFIIRTGWKKETGAKNAFDVLKSTLNIPLAGPVESSQTINSVIETTTYEGNCVDTVSPYHFFPDPRFPVSRFQEGEFVAFEEETSRAKLYELEAKGQVYGIKYVDPISKRVIEERGVTRLSEWLTNKVEDEITAPQSIDVDITTQIQVTIIPAKFIVEGKPVGTSTIPEKWNIWYVNDSRIIKCEKLGYDHGEFTYDVAQLHPDQHHLLNQGISELCHHMQDVYNWFINSHITSVRKMIDNRAVVDAKALNMDDLTNRSPIIRTTSSFSGDIRRHFAQLDQKDVTQAHVGDAQLLFESLKTITGINETLLGQFAQGRRSATEARGVVQSAIGRIKMLVSLLSTQGYRKMAKRMLSNLKQGITEEIFQEVVGASSDPLLLIAFQTGGNYNFKIFDPATPIEKSMQADALQELLAIVLPNPQILQIFPVNIPEVIKSMLTLRGLRNVDRFFLDPKQALMAQIMLQLQNQNGQSGSNSKPGPNGSPANANGLQPNPGLPVAPSQAGGPGAVAGNNGGAGGLAGLLRP